MVSHMGGGVMAETPGTRSYGLSKSRLLSWLQCPKRLWLETHRREAVQYAETAQVAFNVGHGAGEAARRLEPRGVLIGHQDDLTKALAETSAQVHAGTRVLFEPAFVHEGVLVRVDILKRKGSGYQLREVKASSSVKDVHLPDAAIQLWTLRGGGVKVDSVAIQYIDTRFVYQGDGQYRGLFRRQAVDDEIRILLKEAPKWVRAAQATLEGKEPRRSTGEHCRTPYRCPCFDYCSSKEPRTEFPVAMLPHGAKTIPALLAEGYQDIRHIPEGRLASEIHERIRRVTKSGRAELSSAAHDAVRQLSYPRYYFDFETVAPAVPLWAGTRPFQQIPFQWSCHIERTPGSLTHRSYLDTSGDLPVEGVVASMIRALGEDGPIFAHNAGFEKARISELADMTPKNGRALRRISKRLIDTLPLAKTYYYHPSMKGSWSLKAILPTIARELGYETLDEVQDGGQAAAAYMEIIAPGTTVARRSSLIAALERYCERDTLALVRLLRFLETGK